MRATRQAGWTEPALARLRPVSPPSPILHCIMRSRIDFLCLPRQVCHAQAGGGEEDVAQPAVPALRIHMRRLYNAGGAWCEWQQRVGACGLLQCTAGLPLQLKDRLAELWGGGGGGGGGACRGTNRDGRGGRAHWWSLNCLAFARVECKYAHMPRNRERQSSFTAAQAPQNARKIKSADG